MVELKENLLFFVFQRNGKKYFFYCEGNSVLFFHWNFQFSFFDIDEGLVFPIILLGFPECLGFFRSNLYTQFFSMPWEIST